MQAVALCALLAETLALHSETVGMPDAACDVGNASCVVEAAIDGASFIQRPPCNQATQLDDSVKRVFDSIQSHDGVLLKFLGGTLSGGGTFPVDADKWYESLNDCGAQDCSAWNFYRKGLVPIVYGPPLNTHGVGIIVESPDKVWQEVKYSHVTDAVTLGRASGPSTVYPDISSDYPACPNGKDPTELDVVCHPDTVGDVSCQLDSTKGPDYYYYAKPVGKTGEDWTTSFMTKFPSHPDALMVTRELTSYAQCAFTTDFHGVFVNSLQAFYQEATKAPLDSHKVPLWAIDNWKNAKAGGGYYLENEINMIIPKARVQDEIVKPHVNAVWVQLEPCSTNLYSEVSAAECQEQMQKESGSEDQVVKDTLQRGCDLAAALKSFTGRDIPVFSVSFLNAYFPNSERWNYFQQGPDPSEYMKVQDCKAL